MEGLLFNLPASSTPPHKPISSRLLTPPRRTHPEREAKYPDTIIVIFSGSVSAAYQETVRGNDADYYMVKEKCSGSMILGLVELYLISRGYDRYGHKLDLARER